MTLAIGTKVRYETTFEPLENLNGIEGIVVKHTGWDTTHIKVTKGSSLGTHQEIIGTVQGFGAKNLRVVEEEKTFKVGDRVQVNDPESETHHGLVGVITQLSTDLGEGIVKADIDESCDAFKEIKKWNVLIDGKDWYLKVNTLEPVSSEKPKVGGAISYEQVERGQKIEVSYKSKGVIHSRVGVVGTVIKHKNTYSGTDNWTINVLDDEAERYGGKGQRLNWGSEKNKETIVLLEAAPEVDAVLERLVESKGGTVIRAFANQFLVREPFSDTWRNWSNQKSYSSETLRREAGTDIVFFVEDTEGH